MKSYKYTKASRLFDHDLSSVQLSNSKPLNDIKPTIKIDPASDPNRPLEHMKFTTAGKLSRTVADIRDFLSNLGAKHTTRIDDTVVALITTTDEISQKSQKIVDSQELGIHVVSEDFLNELTDKVLASAFTIDVLASLIDKHLLCTWTCADIRARIIKSDPGFKRNQDKSEAERSSGTTVKMKVKGGAAVDPDTGLEDEAHVVRQGYDAKSDLYSVVLGLVDIVRGTNSYYKLQVLKHDTKSTYYVFRAWGRTGSKSHSMRPLENPIKYF